MNQMTPTDIATALRGLAVEVEGLVAAPPPPPPPPPSPPPVPVPVPTPPPMVSPTTLPLVKPTSLGYLGAFRLPIGPTNPTSFDYASATMAWDAARGALFVGGHSQYKRVAEVSAPVPVVSTNLNDLFRAQIVQAFADPFDSKGLGYVIGGLLTDGATLYASGDDYYDGNGTQAKSHYVSAADLSVATDALGPFQVGPTLAGFVSGYMGWIPKVWRALLGGPALTGQACLSIVSRTNYGAGVSVFDPTQLNVINPVPAVQVLAQTAQHRPIAGWADPLVAPLLFNANSTIRGVVFPEGSRSVLFIGRQGIGPYGYGEGTTIQSLDGTAVPNEPGVKYCYDFQNTSKGQHGFPYIPTVWAYDANDLLTVLNGQAKPWDIKPYAVWQLSVPFIPTAPNRLPDVLGAAYDPSNGVIYMSVAFGDGDRPVVHAFKVSV